jgi:hypothetical protein
MEREMKMFNTYAAQGEINIRRIGDVPADGKFSQGFTQMKPENGKFIVGHSETGHHHVVSARDADVAVLDRAPEGMRILQMIVTNPSSVDHLRPHDTHESIAVQPGMYEIRIGREFDPYQEIARRQAD